MRAVMADYPGAVSALQHAKDVCGRIGLFKTMHKIDEATKEIGFEVADLRTAFDSSPRRRPRRKV